MESSDLCDIWKLRNQNVKQFTWRQRTPLIQRRQDYFFVSNDFQESVAKVDVLAAVASDHSAIRLILCESKELIRGPSYWKFDSSLVNDKIYVENLNNELTQYTYETNQMTDPRTRSDFLKFKIKVFSRKYSIEKAEARKARRHVLENKLQQQEVELTADQNNVSIEKYENVKAELDQLYNHTSYHRR